MRRWVCCGWWLLAACAGGPPGADPADDPSDDPPDDPPADTDDRPWDVVEDPLMLRALLVASSIPKESRPDRVLAAGDAECPGVVFPMVSPDAVGDVDCVSPVGMTYRGRYELAEGGLVARYENFEWFEVPGSGAGALMQREIPWGSITGALDDGAKRPEPGGVTTFEGEMTAGVLADIGVGAAREIVWSFQKELVDGMERHQTHSDMRIDQGRLIAVLDYQCDPEVPPSELCVSGTLRFDLDGATIVSDITQKDPATGCAVAVSGRGVEVPLCL